MSQHDEANQDPNLAFTLKAVNEEAKRIWADSKNRSRYVPAEPALQFFFNHSPKNFDKRFVLGSNYKSCDALLSDPGDSIPEEMLAFTFNKQHQLIMNVVSDHQASVTFKQQKQGNRKRFSWIFPHGDHQIRVKVANGIEFDVVLPEYGRNKTEFYNNCKQFLGSSTNDDLLSYSIEVDTGAIASYDNETSKRQKPFYLRGRKIGSGSYGDVFQALQMPGGNIVAAKRFHSTRDFRNEVAMLRKVCEETQHDNIVQFVEEWDEDYKPVLIMEYAAGGDLRKQIDNEMGYGQIGNFAMQTLSALEFTHGQNIMHRDLKPENILCPGPNRYILADFGLSKDVGASASRRGTDFYMAPEIDGSSPYDCKVDMWSLGVILSECLKGLPAGGPNPGQIQRWCQEVAWHFEQYYKQAESERQMAESSFFTIMRIVKDWLLILEPEERSSAEEIQQLAEPELWDAIFQEETFDPASDAITPSETNEDGSFEPSPLESSTSEETNGSSSLTNPSNITTRTSPVGPRTLYDPACVEPSPSFASDQ